MLPFTSCFVGSGQKKITLHTTLTMTVSTINSEVQVADCYFSSGMPHRLINAVDAVAHERRQGRYLRFCGRFSTIRKRRRKKPVTSDLRRNIALLDDIYNGSTKTMLNQISLWPFNAFSLDRATGGRPLPTVCFHLFHVYGLFSHFHLDPVKVFKFFSLVEDGYRCSNPYHNAIHATDVTQAMHCFLLEEKMRSNITPLEIVGSLIAAMAHDLDHPGVNQPFLVATSNHLASLYKNASVLENHHWRSAMGCLLESGILDTLDRSSFMELQNQIKSLILATDIARQQEFLFALQEYLKSNSLDMRRKEHRHFMLQIALKCADISNPCRPWEISRAWSVQVTEEFYRQGDLERDLGLAVTPLCDRYTSSMSKIQIGFFRFIAAPLFEEWHRFHDTTLSARMLSYLRSNERKWEAILNHEHCGNEHLAKALLESTNDSNCMEASAEEQSLPMDYLASPTTNVQTERKSREPADLLDSTAAHQYARENFFLDEELDVVVSPIADEPLNDSAFRAVFGQEKENIYRSSGEHADGVNSANGQFVNASGEGQDAELTSAVIHLKKDKKAKKVFQHHFSGILSASTKKQLPLPLPGGKKSISAVNSSKPVLEERVVGYCENLTLGDISFKEGPRLVARRGSAPTTHQTLLDISRLKRSCVNSNRSNASRLSKYGDGYGLRRRGSLPYDIGRRITASEWGTSFSGDSADPESARGDSFGLHSNVAAQTRCKAPSVNERLICKDADVAVGASVAGLTRDCVSNFLLRDCRSRSFRRRRSGGPELFSSIVWRSPIAQITRPPQSVHLNAMLSSQEISNRSIGELCSGEANDRLCTSGSGPMELLAEMWRYKGSRSERSSIDSDDHFLKSHFSGSCYNSLSSDGLHYLGKEELHLLPEFARTRRRSSCPFAHPSALEGSTSCLAIR